MHEHFLPYFYKKYPTIEEFANCDIAELEEIIHPCGFYKNKAKNARACANKILDTFNGVAIIIVGIIWLSN